MMPISSSKWSLHRFYLKHPAIRTHLPPTTICHKRSLVDYLGKFSSVYVKPDREHRGKGIMKVWKKDRAYHLVHVKGSAKRYQSIGEVYRKIRQKSNGARFIVQKGIPLARVNGRVFDIRVMMMRNGQGAWQYAGMIAKVAGTRSVITNVARGKGYVLKVDRALLKSGKFSASQRIAILKRLRSLSYTVANYFNRYKYSSQIGVDYGVDSNGKITIIEVNFDFPSHSLFAKLPDKTDFWRIRRLYHEFKARRKRR